MYLTPIDDEAAAAPRRDGSRRRAALGRLCFWCNRWHKPQMPLGAVGFMEVEAALRARGGPWLRHGRTLSHGVGPLACPSPGSLLIAVMLHKFI